VAAAIPLADAEQDNKCYCKKKKQEDEFEAIVAE
jgi:hypothetical protein